MTSGLISRMSIRRPVAPVPLFRTRVALGMERAPNLAQGPIFNVVDDHVVALSQGREVLLAVVDDVICAERPNQLDVGRAADARHVGAERLGDLDLKSSDPTGGAVDQQPLAGRDVAGAESMKSRKRGCRNRSSLLEAERLRLRYEVVLGRLRVLGARTLANAEHRSPGRKRVTSAPTASTSPATSNPGTPYSGPQKPRREPHRER